MVRHTLEGSVSDPARMPARLLARYLAPFAGREGPNHLLRLASSIRSDDLTEEEIEGIESPTLVVWGDQDRWIDPKLAERLVNLLPSARLTRIHGVGRLVPEESAEQFCELLLSFARVREPV